MSLVLALDQGTTSSRALLFDVAGGIVGMAQREYPQHYPEPGWVEQDPRDIWQSQLGVAREVMATNGIDPEQIAAIGIANQRETTLLWDRRTGEPLHNAIVWQDRRTGAACDTLVERGEGPRIRSRTGLEIDAYFSATKLAWLLDHVPGSRERAQRGEIAFGTVDAWLLWNLTAGRVHATDPSNASRTMLFDLHKCAWDDALLELFQIPRELLPDLRPSHGDFGHTTLFGGEIPIRGVLGDQQAALLGQGCCRAGMVKCTYGTGCFLLMHTGAMPVESRHRLLTTIAWQRAGRVDYALEGSVFSAGAIIQWLRDGLGIIQTAADVEGLAGSVADTGGVMLVPAFTGLGAPHWNPHARAAIVQMTRGTTKAHIARAALEAIAQQVADVVEAMGADIHAAGGSGEGGGFHAGGLPAFELWVDGGAAANDLLLQIQADVLGVPVFRHAHAEATAAGARAIALAQPTTNIRRAEARVFHPQIDAARRQSARERWQRTLKEHAC